MNELVVKEYSTPPSVLDQEPSAMIARTTKVAEILSKVIRDKGLSQSIQGKEYVQVEGWELAGTMLGFVVREKEIKEQPDGSFEAWVELYHPASGRVISHASALCGMDEKRWSRADRFARRSMAVTRATGKVYRMNFAWIIKMAGFQPTPEEEMPAEMNRSTARGDLYNSTDQTHKRWLMTELKKTSLPQDGWGKISTALHGKYEDELPMVITDYLAEASKM